MLKFNKLLGKVEIKKLQPKELAAYVQWLKQYIKLQEEVLKQKRKLFMKFKGISNQQKRSLLDSNDKRKIGSLLKRIKTL